MTLEWDRGKRVARCDECGELLKNNRGEVIRHDRDDFDILIDDLRRQGWESEKGKNGWEHTCLNCQ